ncbi:MAG: alpha-hydroxy-acid oxidizing protein [Nocardioidaceae bacterium]|nr:alpha-hydroxy-acid oxidizing protein [Nocardioidaceae bacterium]
MRRRVPRPRELAPLLKLRRPRFGRRRRLELALTVEDLRRLARRRTPKAAFDYTEGGAESEASIARAHAAFDDIVWHPSVLRDVTEVRLGTDVLGSPSALPVGIAPTGFTRLMHAEGEIAGATAARDKGIPFALSTMATTSIEDVAAAAPGGRHWFQLYMWKDRDRSMALVERARVSGYEALVVTVDVPVAGGRLRDVRNGLTLPPTLTARTLADIARHPSWWFDLVTTEPLAFASLDRWPGTVAELLDSMFDPSVELADLRWIREQWPGKLVVKGVQSVADAERVAGCGVDAILLSNHGGRQLDRAPVPFLLVPEVRRAVGRDVEVWVDGGIRRGQDVLAALAAGADFTLVGRTYLYGLMAGGRAGVDRCLAILENEMTRTLKLLGVTDVADLGPEHVTQLGTQLGSRR